MVNVTITKSFIEPHAASLLKGPARVMDFSQGAKYIFKKPFLQFASLTCLTYFYTDWVILFHCQSNLLLDSSDGIPINKRLGETKNFLKRLQNTKKGNSKICKYDHKTEPEMHSD